MDGGRQPCPSQSSAQPARNATLVQEERHKPAIAAEEDNLERTHTVGGTDVTDYTASYMRLKKLLKTRGIDTALVDSCSGVHQLKLLGIKQGVLRDQQGAV